MPLLYSAVLPYLDCFHELLPDGVGEVWREGTVHVGAQLVQVDLNDLVVRSTLVGAKVFLEGVRRRGKARPLGCLLVSVVVNRLMTGQRVDGMGWHGL